MAIHTWLIWSIVFIPLGVTSDEGTTWQCLYIRILDVVISRRGGGPATPYTEKSMANLVTRCQIVVPNKVSCYTSGLRYNLGIPHIRVAKGRGREKWERRAREGKRENGEGGGRGLRAMRKGRNKCKEHGRAHSITNETELVHRNLFVDHQVPTCINVPGSAEPISFIAGITVLL